MNVVVPEAMAYASSCWDTSITRLTGDPEMRIAYDPAAATR
jgi:hypothetical protein